MSRWDNWLKRARKAAFGRSGPMRVVLEHHPRAWCGQDMRGEYIVCDVGQTIGTGSTPLKAWEAARVAVLADTITK